MRTKSRPASTKPPADFDEVKRRFIRQNRELAKNNSTQSLRIRSLELEVSRLLSENLGLRENVLGLQNELQNARKLATSEAVKRVQFDLKARLAELSGLVDELGDVGQEEEDLMVGNMRSSPSQRQYRERQPLAELMQETVMPTITEDKMYPRRTLDADEIRALRWSDQSTASGSPDLGPPPIAHFDCADAVKPYGNQEKPSAEGTNASPPGPTDDDLLPTVNLETRRKRRESKIEIRRHSILAQSPRKDEPDSTTSMLRTGAKRKLADRETEKPIKPPSQGEFTFSRKMSADQSDSAANDLKIEASASDMPIKGEAKPAPAPTQQSRKVLGEKSANMSPRKSNTRTLKSIKEDPPKPSVRRVSEPKERPQSRSRRVSTIPIPQLTDEAMPPFDIPDPGSATGEQVNPKTPAAQDIFSPAASEPSASGHARDTPPPSDLSSISNTTEGGQRPSRRARSAVNYAEPSLISKMRRPDKQMVDAITGLQDPKRVMNPKDRKSLDQTSTSRPVIIKKEPMEDDDLWKDVSLSPLREKSTDDHPPATTSGSAADTLANAKSSAATLSSVIASSRKRREELDRKNQEQRLGKDMDAAAKKMEELDLYDFKDSSSPAADTSDRSAPSASSSRIGHRRHSSVPKDTSITGGSSVVGRVDRMASRRRSMML